MYEPNPKYIQSKAGAKKSEEALLVAMRWYIERHPKSVDELVQAMKDLGETVTREKALADLGFNEVQIQNLLARI